MVRGLALDSNLLLLLVIGTAEPRQIGVHKRLKSFDRPDYDLLLGSAASFDCLLTTPNVLTEVSNLMRQGVHSATESEIVKAFRLQVMVTTEIVTASRAIVERSEFPRLGLTDTAWLACLTSKDVLITTDLDLYHAALNCGLDAHNFNHQRDRNPK